MVRSRSRKFGKDRVSVGNFGKVGVGQFTFDSATMALALETICFNNGKFIAKLAEKVLKSSKTTKEKYNIRNSLVAHKNRGCLSLN